MGQQCLCASSPSARSECVLITRVKLDQTCGPPLAGSACGYGICPGWQTIFQMALVAWQARYSTPRSCPTACGSLCSRLDDAIRQAQGNSTGIHVFERRAEPSLVGPAANGETAGFLLPHPPTLAPLGTYVPRMSRQLLVVLAVGIACKKQRFLPPRCPLVAYPDDGAWVSGRPLSQKGPAPTYQRPSVSSDHALPPHCRRASKLPHAGYCLLCYGEHTGRDNVLARTGVTPSKILLSVVADRLQ